MSSFLCPKCGAKIIEGAGGNYVTGCEHYPLPVKVTSDGRIDIAWGVSDNYARPVFLMKG